MILKKEQGVSALESFDEDGSIHRYANEENLITYHEHPLL